MHIKVRNNNIAVGTARRQKAVDIVTSFAQEKVPILGGPFLGESKTDFCNRELALVTPDRGELRVIVMSFFRGDLATLFDRTRLRTGVMRASADLPDRTGRETEARAAGSDGRDATSRYRFWLLRKAVTTPRSKCSSMTSDVVLLR